MVAGVEAGHWSAYRIVYPDPYVRAQELTGSGHAYLGYWPLFFALVAALGLCGLGGRLFRRGGGATLTAEVSLTPFLLLSPLAFALQECLERLAVGAWPLAGVLTPTFMPGLLFQLPFALAAFLIARWLLGAADRLRVFLFGRRRPALPALGDRAPGRFATPALPRVSALAAGYGERGPPAGLVPAPSAASR
jgi:hypothetical protein